MTYLSVLLVTKIVVTLIFVCLPFGFFQKEKLDQMAGFGSPTVAFYRLYAVAITALVVAYAGGFLQTLAGVYPSQIVAMGLASNLGAAMVMIGTGYARQQPLLTAFFGAVGIGFVGSAVFSDVVMTTVFRGVNAHGAIPI